MIEYLEKKRKVALIFTILMVLEIFFFSTVTGGTTGTGNIWIPRAYHFIAFFLLNFFMIVSIKGNKDIKVRHIFISIIISLIYSILDEIHQMFVPGRDASIGDIITDSFGIFTSAVLYYYMSSKRKINLS